MIRAQFWALVALLGLVPHGLRAGTVTEIHYVMGTYFRVTAEDPDPARARAAMRACFAIARAVDQRFSRFDSTSELSWLNSSSTEPQPTVLSADMAALLHRALSLQVACAVVDPTCRPFDVRPCGFEPARVRDD